MSSSSHNTSRSRFHSRTSLFSGDGAKDFKSSTQHSGKKPDPRHNPPKIVCPVCKASHSLYQCTQFRSSSAAKKLSLLKGWNGCTNCLSHKHQTTSCPSTRRCSICNQGHHTWLHQPQEHTNAAQPAVETSPVKTDKGITLGTICAEGNVLLGTAMVEAKDSHGSYEEVRMVTDSGSQYSFITIDCVKKLGLEIEPCKQRISGIGQVKFNNTIGRLKCILRSRIPSSSSKEFTSQVIVVPKITSNLPQVTLSNSIQTRYKGYALADPYFWKPAPVEMLLGGDLFYDIVTGPPVMINQDIPRLLPTIFGFIIAGPLKSHSVLTEGHSFLVHSNPEMNDIMDKFWEVEEVLPVAKVSAEDEYCEKHFETTHYRLESGRYVVSLPVKETITNLENPKGQAFKRLLNLESKLSRNPTLKKEYHQFMRDYIDLGHMQPVEANTSAYTLPHHAVVKFHNGDLKLRTVFDASCKSISGSLNDHLYVGPKLQLDICELLSNFRTHEVAFTADIVKMYRQILVNPSDRKYQHILWRFDPAEAIKTYELCTVTYGQNCSPYCALRTMIQLVKDEGSCFPLASRALLEDIYVDDLATGAASVKEALNLQAELQFLLRKGCFQLSKWASNNPALLKGLGENECQLSAISLSTDEEPKIKLLGMQWIPNQDVFTYEVTPPSRNPSKRAILSAIAHIYDPLGFLAPVVFYAKVILQDMWISQCAWDETGPPDLCFRWYRFLDQLQSLSNIRIPRKICHAESPMIVGFCDASQRGYSAVLYLVNRTSHGSDIHLLKAKTKLAPIKPMTIPRLELSGALLLSRLYKSCNKLMNKLSISESYFFTDSALVLGWLSTPPQRLNTFVAHRVVLILEITNRSKWSHIKSEGDPADCSSRGILPSELEHHPLWWAGPHWLALPMEQWPNLDVKLDNLPELKSTNKAVVLSASQSSPPWIMEWMEHFSNYQKLINSMSYVLRFINYLKSHKMKKGPLTLKELRLAKIFCIKLTQCHYKIDAKQLKTLSCFIDDTGILRVGGRLQNSSLQPDAKHPVIISNKSHFAKLLVEYYHRSYLHMGSSSLQAILQSKYWIIGARNLIRQRVFNCIRCYKTNHQPKAPIMGNLPAFRLQEGSVFQHVGVDFGGPFPIRESRRRKAALGKSYLCLFICMSTRAVHLEAVSRCSTEAFLAALDRFIARRGKPSSMYSDCGSNFVGAANRLKDVIKWQRSSQVQQQIVHHANQQEIEWSFNPPSAPHFGGIWEAGIKAAKSILYKVIGDTPLTFEELSTLFCQIKGVMNSRPIAPLTTDPDSIECLTPGHFLIGRPIIAAPEWNLTSESISPLKRWDLIKQRAQHFWIRWRTEYLHTLQQRRKWTSHFDNLKEGDLVIVKDPNSPLRSWPLARVVSTHPGRDGVVRVVTIRSPTGTYKRPVTKIVPLVPVNEPFQ